MKPISSVAADAKRDATLDVAKGMAIVAIVFGHIWRGLWSAGLISSSHWFQTLDSFTYLFHLTVFAFISGLFVEKGVRKQGAGLYARARTLQFLWLYLLWSLIQGLLVVSFSGQVNSPKTLSNIIQLWQPQGQFWFFGWIIVLTLGTVAIRPWLTSLRKYFILALAGTTSIVCWGYSGTVIGTQGLGLSIFFVLATLMKPESVTWLLSKFKKSWLALMSLIGLATLFFLAVNNLATPPTLGLDSRTPLSILIGFTATLVGLWSILAVSRVWSETKVGELIGYLGKDSLAIFVSHIIFTAATRIVLLKVGVTELSVHILLSLCAGIFGPLFIVFLSRKLRLTWLFDAPLKAKRSS